MTRLYGIANCDKVKKAKIWLEAREIPYDFHDFRRDGLSSDLVSRWYNNWQDSMINRRSTTWRGLTEDARALASDSDAINLLVNNPTLIQRPVLEHSGKLLMNFSDASYADFFN
jgi:arsenate reductase